MRWTATLSMDCHGRMDSITRLGGVNLFFGGSSVKVLWNFFGFIRSGSRARANPNRHFDLPPHNTGRYELRVRDRSERREGCGTERMRSGEISRHKDWSRNNFLLVVPSPALSGRGQGEGTEKQKVISRPILTLESQPVSCSLISGASISQQLTLVLSRFAAPCVARDAVIEP